MYAALLDSGESGQSESQTEVEESTNVMPTGRVVGIVRRNWREYVASFAENEVNKEWKSDGSRGIHQCDADWAGGGNCSQELERVCRKLRWEWGK